MINESGTVIVETVGSVATMTLNRPKVLNAINRLLLSDLSTELERLESDEKIAVLVIRGAGEKAFSAGADVNEFTSLSNEGMLELMNEGHAVFQRIAEFRCPVICAVHGYALGGGFELALSADYILASEGASFAFPELSLGSFPGWGGTLRLSQAVGTRQAKELIFTGARIGAAAAHRLGVVNQVFGGEGFFDEVAKRAEAMAAQSRVAVQLAKRVLNAEAGQGDRALLLLEALGVASIASTKDRSDRLKAFAERRT